MPSPTLSSGDSVIFNEQILLLQLLMIKKREGLRNISHSGRNAAIKLEKVRKRAKQIMPRQPHTSRQQPPSGLTHMLGALGNLKSGNRDLQRNAME